MRRFASVLSPIFVCEAGDGEEHKTVVAMMMMLDADDDGISALADASLPTGRPCLTVGGLTSVENSAEIVNKDWGEKAQLLRSIQLTTGVSKLGIKLLAMQAKLEEVPPNSVIVPQGSQVHLKLAPPVCWLGAGLVQGLHDMIWRGWHDIDFCVLWVWL